jgi:hypothetical protein
MVVVIRSNTFMQNCHSTESVSAKHVMDELYIVKGLNLIYALTFLNCVTKVNHIHCMDNTQWKKVKALNYVSTFFLQFTLMPSVLLTNIILPYEGNPTDPSRNELLAEK